MSAEKSNLEQLLQSSPLKVERGYVGEVYIHRESPNQTRERLYTVEKPKWSNGNFVVSVTDRATTGNHNFPGGYLQFYPQDGTHVIIDARQLASHIILEETIPTIQEGMNLLRAWDMATEEERSGVRDRNRIIDHLSTRHTVGQVLGQNVLDTLYEDTGLDTIRPDEIIQLLRREHVVQR